MNWNAVGLALPSIGTVLAAVLVYLNSRGRNADDRTSAFGDKVSKELENERRESREERDRRIEVEAALDAERSLRRHAEDRVWQLEDYIRGSGLPVPKDDTE